jgi:hypothetical protein
MADSSSLPVDWSDFSRRKIQAVMAIVCVPFAFFVPAVWLGNKTYMPFIAIPTGIVALVVHLALLRRLQLVICPKCGGSFMDQDDNPMFSWVAWRILFSEKCKSCGAHRWMD